MRQDLTQLRYLPGTRAVSLLLRPVREGEELDTHEFEGNENVLVETDERGDLVALTISHTSERVDFTALTLDLPERSLLKEAVGVD